MGMPAVAEKSKKQVILDELKAFVDSSIDKMSPQDILGFEQRSETIMKRSKRRMQKSAETRGKAQSRGRARRA